MLFRKAVCGLVMTAMTLSLSSCSATNSENSSNADDIIVVAKEISYDTVKPKIDNIGTAYYVQGEFRYPYTQSVFITHSGTLGKLYLGSEIEEGELICEVLVDELQEEIDKQELVTKSAEDTYKSLKRSGVRGSELEYAEINMELEKLKLQKLLDEQEDTKIYATCSGKIMMNSDISEAGVQVWKGEYLCQITDKSRSYLCAFVYNNPLQNVNFGSKVNVKQGAKVDVEGKVIDIIYKDGGKDYSGYYYVIDVPDDSGLMDFGEITVVFETEMKENVIVIPVKALRQSGLRKYVNVLIDGAKVEVDVETGLSNDNYIEIVSGLEGDEQLVVG